MKIINIVLTIAGTTISITAPFILFFIGLYIEKNVLAAFLAAVFVTPFAGLLLGISWIKN